MLRLADLVRERSGREAFVFFVKRNYRRLAEHSAAVIAHGHRWLDADGMQHVEAAQKQEASEGGKAAAVAPIKMDEPHPLRALAVDLVNCFAEFRKLSRRDREIQRVVNEVDPSLVVVGQVTLGSELAFLANAARAKDIPCLLLPFAMFNVEEFIEFAAGRPTHHVEGRILNRIFAKLYPRWVRTVRGRALLRLPAARALALELADLASEEPWGVCPALVTQIACDSEKSRDALIAMGVEPSRLRVTGSAVQDRLSSQKTSELRRALFSRYGLDPARPLLVCGWPANIFPWAGSRKTAYPDYPSLARAWSQILSSIRDNLGFQVLLSVHPKTFDEEIDQPRAFDLMPVRGESEVLIAQCDVFTTLNGSSITAWALACAKPVVLFDCFDTRYPEFENVPGCIMTRDEASFRKQLGNLCESTEARQAAGEKLRAEAPRWGVLDGRAGERIAVLIDGMMVRRCTA